MASWIALSPTRHRDAGYLPRTDFHFCADRLATPVLLPELRLLVPHMVLGIQVVENVCTPVALLALAPGYPLYVGEDGAWQLGYVPAMLRAYPFAVQTTESGQRALCLHEDYLSEQKGTPLFTGDGELNAPVAETFAFLEGCEAGLQQARAAAGRLQAAGVLELWELTIKTAQGETNPYPLPGLYKVNEDALNTLDASAYHALQGGPMALAHAQLYAMQQRQALAERAAARRQPAFKYESDLIDFSQIS